MKTYSLSLFAAFLLSLVASCKKEESVPDPFACEEALGLYQVGQNAGHYIKGKLNGQAFYYGDSASPFKVHQAVVNTSGGEGTNPRQALSFGLFDTLMFRYAYLPAIHRPLFNMYFSMLMPGGVSAIEAADQFLKPGSLALTSPSTPYNEPGIGIVMDISCDNKLFSVWRSSTGNQNNSYFKVNTVERIETETAVSWTVTADFDMNIYKDVFGERLWNRIAEGSSRITFSINK